MMSMWPASGRVDIYESLSAVERAFKDGGRQYDETIRTPVPTAPGSLDVLLDMRDIINYDCGGSLGVLPSSLSILSRNRTNFVELLIPRYSWLWVSCCS